MLNAERERVRERKREQEEEGEGQREGGRKRGHIKFFVTELCMMYYTVNNLNCQQEGND